MKLEGYVREDIHGSISDVDKGTWVGDTFFSDSYPLSRFRGQYIRLTVEVIPAPNKTDEDEGDERTPGKPGVLF